MIEEIVYLDRDNAASMTLKDNSSGTMSAADLSLVTRVDVHYGENTISSVDQPTLVTWTAAGVVSLKLGTLDISSGTYHAYIVTYDAVNTNGIRWPGFSLIVEEI